ncbi:MAG: Arc family DNA-binding protein [Clostridiales bacterium]|nr:Arc family DNA-binding protein [Clostridiales bacterium]HOA85579.1 Arc family DNA-binding protein [Bacillota bacterium]
MSDTIKKRNSDTEKKQIPLRLSASLFNELSAWAADEFRSLNGQIEYLLTECVKKWRRGSDLPDDGKKTSGLSEEKQ